MFQLYIRIKIIIDRFHRKSSTNATFAFIDKLFLIWIYLHDERIVSSDFRVDFVFHFRHADAYGILKCNMLQNKHSYTLIKRHSFQENPPIADIVKQMVSDLNILFHQ